MTAPSSYMIYLGKVAPSVSTVSVQWVNKAITDKNASRYLVYLQMALQNNGYYADGLCDGRWTQHFQDELQACRDQQYALPQFGPFNVPTVSKAFVADFMQANLDGCYLLPVVD